MTIKDIARIAGVSASTVSKILNDKDQGISEETRQHVLQVAKQYHYTPYAGIKSKNERKKYLLGLACHLDRQSGALIRAIERAASGRDYSLVLYNNSGERSSALRNINIAEQTVDGLVFIPGQGKADDSEQWKDLQLPMVVIHGDVLPFTAYQYTHDYQAAGKLALEHLYSSGHRRIGLLIQHEGETCSRDLRYCLENFYSNQELIFDRNMIATQNDFPALLQTGITAVICETPALVSLFQHFLSEQGYVVPQEMSIICLREGEAEPGMEKVSAIELDADALAQKSIGHLADILEIRERSVGRELIDPHLCEGETVCPPDQNPIEMVPILVVGTMNEDVVINVSALPAAGETIMIDSVSVLSGGKGANQAVCAAKLGGNVSLIGRIGNDAGGKLSYSALRQHGVNTKGISVDRERETGKAFLNVSRTGESFIEVLPGANGRLGKKHIERNAELFENAKYCLVQTELSPSTVKCVLKYASENQAHVICKPCSIGSIPAEWQQKIHIIVPNQKEAARLAGETKSIEEQAQFFRKNGCKHVIITLAEKGCYYLGEDGEGWFPAYDEPGTSTVDTSGACDAFIGALALRLTEGYGMAAAIRYANVAAGISVTRAGVQPSLPDRTTMEIRRNAYMDL